VCCVVLCCVVLCCVVFVYDLSDFLPHVDCLERFSSVRSSVY